MPPNSLSLDDLVILCDEIKSLAASGAPLDRGLRNVARDLTGRNKRIASLLGRRIEAGESLEQILASPEMGFPPIFRAVVEAGRRTGQLPYALEGICEATRRTADLRRIIVLSMIYPLLILAVVVGLSIVVLRQLAETLDETVVQHRLSLKNGLGPMIEYTRSFGDWIWMIPAFAIGLIVIWWWQTRKSASAEPAWFASKVAWAPWAGRLLRFGRLATFSDVLALLIEHNVPTHDAIHLAAEASGDKKLSREAGELAVRLRAGDKGAISECQELPPLLRWLLRSGASREKLVTSLRVSARSYRSRAESLAELLGTQLPVLLTFLIGGTATLGYVTAVALPWFSLLTELSKQITAF